MTSIEIEIRRYLKNWFIEYGAKITKEEDIFCNSCPLNGFKIIKSFKDIPLERCKANFKFLMQEENDDVYGCYNFVKKVIEKYYCNKSMNNE